MTRSAANAAASVERFFELSLLGLLTSGYLAVAGSGYLDPPTSILTAAGLVVRGLMVVGVIRGRISPGLATVFTLAYVVFYPIDYLFISGEFLPSTVHLVFFLALIKILTANSNRDYIFLSIIAFLELLSASVLSSNLNFFIFLAFFLLFGVGAFASSEMRRSMKRPSRVARGGMKRLDLRLTALALVVTLGILSLTGGLFFLLPRTAQAAFRHLVPQRYHIAGFSNDMELGEIGQIQQRRTPVMHVKLVHPQRRMELKWRGIGLAQFDGRRWFNPPDPGTPLLVKDGLLALADKSQYRPTRTINYEIQLSGIGTDALFFAGRPEFLIINTPLVIRTATDSFRLGFGLSEGVRYGVASSVEEDSATLKLVPGMGLPAPVRSTYLQLPAIDPRIPELAKKLTGGLGSETDKALVLERHLRTQYGYTLELPSKEVPDPLAHFLFQRKRGHCEYFSSAMAIMLRTVGIPSRVANGFQSGTYNPVSGWYVIRASDAHSWVEAFLPGRGWTTFDPTPPDPNPNRLSFWARIGFYMDAADTFWQEWVLNYDLNRQLVLASKMESSSRSFGSQWRDGFQSMRRVWSDTAEWVKENGAELFILLVICAAALYGLPKGWRWARARRRMLSAQRGGARASDATILYDRLLVIMRRRGFEKPVWLTPSEFARTLSSDPAAPLVQEFTSAYNELRFGREVSAAPRMVQILGEIQRVEK